MHNRLPSSLSYFTTPPLFFPPPSPEILQQAIRTRNGGTQAPAADDDSLESRAQRALSGISLAGLRQLLASGGIRLQTEEDDEEDEDDDEDGWYGNSGGNRRGASGNMNDFWEQVKEPVQAGKELLESGEFGRVSVLSLLESCSERESERIALELLTYFYRFCNARLPRDQHLLRLQLSKSQSTSRTSYRPESLVLEECRRRK